MVVNYKYKLPPFNHQVEALDTGWDRIEFGLFMEMGTGKSKVLIDNMGMLYLSGLIDFYFACNDALAYDIAICINAWCFEADASLNITKARALLRGYAAVRPLSRAEYDALPQLARGAALRFLLTRLYDWLNHDEAAFVRPKDPRQFLDRLRFHQQVDGPGAYGISYEDLNG